MDITDHLAKLESLRREVRNMDSNPTAATVQDYSGPCLKIQHGLHHLDEGLPIGQANRVEAAFAMLREGTEELAVWLRHKGYKI